VPGDPCPVLGSTLATVLVAGAVGLATTVAVWHPSTRRRASSRRAFAFGFGVSYAVVSIALWAVVRAVAYPSSFSGYGTAIVFWVALAVLGAVLIGGGTAYVYDRFRYATALLSLFAATAFTWYGFLLVGGETDVLWIWAFLFVPVLVAGTVALLVVEWLIRRLLGRQKNSGRATA
jgi:hypothetical protein